MSEKMKIVILMGSPNRKGSTNILVENFVKCSSTRLGRLVANREVPVLKRAKELLDVKE